VVLYVSRCEIIATLSLLNVVMGIGKKLYRKDDQRRIEINKSSRFSNWLTDCEQYYQVTSKFNFDKDVKLSHLQRCLTVVLSVPADQHKQRTLPSRSFVFLRFWALKIALEGAQFDIRYKNWFLCAVILYHSTNKLLVTFKDLSIVDRSFWAIFQINLWGWVYLCDSGYIV
jgi:hypothetical protein